MKNIDKIARERKENKRKRGENNISLICVAMTDT
jgi:hypothetical protein